MGLVLAVALCAFVVGRLAGGTLPRLASVPVRSARLLGVAVVVQVVGALLAGHVPAAYPVGAGLAGLALVLFLVRNHRLLGVPLAALGLLGNVAVIVANGAMPVSTDAAVRAGVPTTQQTLREDPRHEPLTADTRLPWLAERLPVALPPRREVASAGDVLLAAGLGLYVAGGMNRARRSPRLPASTSWDAWPRPSDRPRGVRPEVPEPGSNVRARSD